MATSTTRQARPKKSARKKPVVRVLTRTQVGGAIRTMFEPKGTARFAAGKALVVTAEKAPERVYPGFDAVAALLGSDSRIVRWNAMQILARLAGVDKEGKIDEVLDAFIRFIKGGNMVTAANAINGLARIVLARPDLIERTLPAMLGVENESYETPECRNVAIGHALKALAELWPLVSSRPEVAAFVKRQQGNTRAAVARKAGKLAAELP